jgi:hypothetical protein
MTTQFTRSFADNPTAVKPSITRDATANIDFANNDVSGLEDVAAAPPTSDELEDLLISSSNGLVIEQGEDETEGKLVLSTDDEEIVGNGLASILETSGALLINSGGNAVELPPGSEGEVLTIVGGVPDYAAPATPTVNGFAGKRNAGQAAAVTVHAIIIPDVVDDNTGNLMNALTGVFTAAANGYYVFGANISQSAGSTCFARVWKNPAIASGNVSSGTQVNYNQFNSAADDGRLAGCVWLNAGDTLVFTCSTNNAGGGNITARHLTIVKR